MGSSRPNSQRKTFIFCLLSLSLTLLFLTILSLRDPTYQNPTNTIFTTSTTSSTTTRKLNNDNDEDEIEQPEWLKIIIQQRFIKNNTNITNTNTKITRVGFLNPKEVEEEEEESFRGRYSYNNNNNKVESVRVIFESIAGSGVKWEDIFPEWIDEDSKWASPKCPKIPLPSSTRKDYDNLDVVVVRLSCNIVDGKMNSRDVVRLQENLAAASLAVRGIMGNGNNYDNYIKEVYVVFLGTCGPMSEIFRCEDIVKYKRGEFWVYKPNLFRLKQKLLMPVGTCQLAHPYALPGKEAWRVAMGKNNNNTKGRVRGPRYAYATILHSSESYVCGAVALAQSIRRTNSTHDLVLLADTSSISPRSISALRSAGWNKIVPIFRIRSPFASKDSYNEWNYSKLRIFQLTWYYKIVFIDSDLVVLKNLDHLMHYPSLSAAPNDRSLFNSGLMVIEPSACLFEEMMLKSFEIVSYNGGDQGFLNEIFVWWHRLSTKTNHLKVYGSGHKEISSDVAAVHYLGLKPWTCYKDYDCNWDMANRHIFASDSAHRKWWEVYDSMPVKLQRHCGLTKKMDWRINKWRKIAMRKNSSDGHWKITPKDPRRHHFVD